MGVPAFYRWLSEKYPKIVEDVLEERVHLLANGQPAPFDLSKPNPSGLECDHLYIDMNGIIHPCSHPEVGPQPTCEEEMFENVCRYVDRLMRIMRPRQLLYLAIDGVAPRAKMNQQRARRFRSAQEARELKELEETVRVELTKAGEEAPPSAHVWDSNVITPGTTFMLRLSEFLRFYVRKRISEDKGWQSIRVIFSDASLPGEGEHKIMSHIRLQRSQPAYNPNLVHVLHGLDADLIMLALATHEAHFYISREEVLFGRKSQEAQEQRQMESGHRDAQIQLDEAAGAEAMTSLEENQHKALQRISIPVLRQYLANEFKSCLIPQQPNPSGQGPPIGLPFAPSLERLIDDIVFLCFFVGNDFLPHLPSLDIRVGALDFLFNVYKRLLPTLGDYITNHGGRVNLSHVDVILAEVGAIEDYVFAMKHESEQQEKQRRQQTRNNRRGGGPPRVLNQPEPKVRGRAARILEKKQGLGQDRKNSVALKRGHQAKEENRQKQKASHQLKEDNLEAAKALRNSLTGKNKDLPIKKEEKPTVEDIKMEDVKAEKESASEVADADAAAGIKKEEEESNVKKEGTEKAEGIKEEEKDSKEKKVGEKRKADDVKKESKKPIKTDEDGAGVVDDSDSDLFDCESSDDEEDDNNDKDTPAGDAVAPVVTVPMDPEAAKRFKERVKSEKQKQLDEYSKNVEDKVRLHEAGWKDRYYSDKCKADDVEQNGGREHMFRSYVMGLCWVMKYYYDGCPSWKWYYPFHYAPFASDLKNIERFQKDCNAFELSTPFHPVEQLMAVLPSDSAHAIPKPARWLLSDEESPIIDFYPVDVPVDPNGKAMPWLWVVLLPFIDEERLLAALGPTMAKWSKDELLCNARGLDDGYLYMYEKHEFGKKLYKLGLEGKKTAAAPKEKLADSASYGFAGFTGSVRPPLSNEVYPLSGDGSEVVKVDLPATASKIDRVSHDNLFSEPIESNEAVCVAFSEPRKLSHKSILLAGANPIPSKLTSEDLRIRRPKLNRFGGTIANLGMSRSGGGQSYQSGYGSMNISSYERELAQKTGRGHEMYQPGMRAWGAMEPAPKRHRGGNHQQPPPQQQQPGYGGHNPFAGQNRGGPPNNNRQQGQRPPWQNRPPHQNQQRSPHQQQHRPPWQPGSQHQRPPQSHQQQYGQQHQQRQHGGHRHQQQQQQQRGGHHAQRHPQQQRPHHQQQHYQQRHQQQQQQQGFNFQAFANQQQGGRQQQQHRPPHQQQQQHQQQQSRSQSTSANKNVMSSLRAQLVSTLKQNRNSGQGQDRR